MQFVNWKLTKMLTNVFQWHSTRWRYVKTNPNPPWRKLRFGIIPFSNKTISKTSISSFKYPLNPGHTFTSLKHTAVTLLSIDPVCPQ